MVYRMKVAGLWRELPICKVTDSLYIAGFVIFGDQELTVACARELLARAPEYDYIITAEAKGIPLAHEMARQAGDKKYILARKGPKLYMRDIFSVSVNSITTAKEQKLYLDGADAALMKGKRILIVDDVISTGESLKACWLSCGVILVDFKLEFGRLADGTIVLADEISPDTCRLWDSKTHEKLDKDRFRRDLGGVEEAYAEIMKRLETKLGG